MRSNAPTAKQAAYLRRLAIVKGVTFTPPRTRAEASATIERLTRVQSTPASDLRRERRELLEDLERRGGSASVLESDERLGGVETERAAGNQADGGVGGLDAGV